MVSAIFYAYQPVQLAQAQDLIINEAKALGLKNTGWRNIEKSTNPGSLSKPHYRRNHHLSRLL